MGHWRVTVSVDVGWRGRVWRRDVVVDEKGDEKVDRDVVAMR